MRTFYEDIRRYFLYIGFGLIKSELKHSTKSIKLEFTSVRERKKFRDLLMDKKPRCIGEVKRMYDTSSHDVIEASVKT